MFMALIQHRVILVLRSAGGIEPGSAQRCQQVVARGEEAT